MNINFNDRIHYQNNNFADFCENFLYLEAFGRKFSVLEEDGNILKLQRKPLNLPRWTQVARTIAKIFLFVLLSIPAFIALVGKAVYRNSYSFEIIKENEQTLKAPPLDEYEIPVELPTIIIEEDDVRGTKKVDSDIIWRYFHELKSKHSGFFCEESKNSYNLSDMYKNILNIHQKPNKKYFGYQLAISNHSHWTLTFVDRERRTIEYYDSLVKYGPYKEITTRLKEIAKTLTLQDPGKWPYRFIKKLNVPLQCDPYNCGAWLLFFLETRLKHPDADFNKMDIARAQKMIANYRCIVTKRMTEQTKRFKEKYPNKPDYFNPVMAQFIKQENES